MGELENLKKQLADINKQKQLKQEKLNQQKTINNLKRQIKSEKFGQTRSGKIFNKIADFGQAGMKVTKRVLSENPKQKKGKKKVPTMQEIMKRLPQ